MSTITSSFPPPNPPPQVIAAAYESLSDITGAMCYWTVQANVPRETLEKPDYNFPLRTIYTIKHKVDYLRAQLAQMENSIRAVHEFRKAHPDLRNEHSILLAHLDRLKDELFAPMTEYWKGAADRRLPKLRIAVLNQELWNQPREDPKNLRDPGDQGSRSNMGPQTMSDRCQYLGISDGSQPSSHGGYGAQSRNPGFSGASGNTTSSAVVAAPEDARSQPNKRPRAETRGNSGTTSMDKRSRSTARPGQQKTPGRPPNSGNAGGHGYS
jgi:hypothetical protein